MRSCNEVPNGSTVLLRACLNVPMQEGKITDPGRLEEARPTIDALRSKGCKIIVAGYLGRPSAPDPSLTSEPAAEYLKQFYPVTYIPEVTGDLATVAKRSCQPGELIVLENVRFDPHEMANDTAYAEKVVEDIDVVVIDAYADAHRAEATTVGVLEHRPGYAGLLLEKELRMMEQLREPEHPYVAIIGGAKADKLSTIKGLLPKVDAILVGGVLANTFLKAAGQPVGESRVDLAGIDEAKALLGSGKIILPVDAVVAERFAKDSNSFTMPVAEIQSGMILDIGPQTVERYEVYLSKAKTIVWAGPIGVFEWPSFAKGTESIAKIVVESGAYTLAAGGDSGAALVTLGYKERITHISTGGGVTLQLLEGKPLAAVIALEQNEKKFR